MVKMVLHQSTHKHFCNIWLWAHIILFLRHFEDIHMLDDISIQFLLDGVLIPFAFVAKLCGKFFNRTEFLRHVLGLINFRKLELFLIASPLIILIVVPSARPFTTMWKRATSGTTSIAVVGQVLIMPYVC